MPLPTNGFAIHQIEHPADPQVNGFGFYRTIDGGSSVLLDQRIQIPNNNEYAVTHYWEAFHLADLTNVSKLQLQFTYDLRDFPTTGQADTTDNTARGTFVWEPGTAPSQQGSLPHKNAGFFYQNHPETNGRQCTYRWEIADGYCDSNSVFKWVYITNVTDASLGAAASTTKDEPPAYDMVAEFQETLFLAGNVDRPNRMFFSTRLEPEAWPSTQFFDVGPASDPIRALEPYIGILGVFTRDTKYAVSGSATAGYVPTEAVSRRGIAGLNCHIASERGILFVARDGVFLTSFVGADKELSVKIKQLFTGSTSTDYSGEDVINWDHADKISCAYHQGRFYCAYPTHGPNFGINTEPNRVMIYSFETQEWYFTNWAARTLLTEDDTDTLTAGFTDGKVYTLESGSTDDGSNIAMTVRTKDFDLGTRALLLFMKVDAEGKDGLTVEVVVDDVVQHTSTITGTRTKTLLPLDEDTWGSRWRLQFSYTGSQEVVIYGFNMYYIPLSSH